MRKILSSFLIFAFLSFIIVPFKTSAETPTSTIVSLLQQIQKLQSQIETLRIQIIQLQQQKQENIVQLLTALKEGSKGETVKTLQALLASDSDIYPEGLITGFYGRLTVEAVKKFQKRHGLDQVGVVGPKTLQKLNEALEKNPMLFEKQNGDEGKRPCAIVPPGHLIAPGWLRKQDGVRPIVPVCQVIPLGIAKKLGWEIPTSTPTSTPDATPPIISLILLTTSSTSATITWMTNEPSTSKVYYSLTSPIDLNSASTKSDASLVLNHSLNLTSLNSSSTYYFVVESKDASNNTATSSQQSFMTLSQ